MENKKVQKNFSSGIDFIKSLAIIFVVCVHFFLHTGFYYQPLSQFTMGFFGFFRNIFFLCVPLFMISTGYLQRKKTVSLKFYTSVIPSLLTYILISVICVFFKARYLNFEGDFKYWLYSVMNFTADNYAWYACMFFGLYLLIPFLNGAYNMQKGKKEKLLLIFILFLISSVAGYNTYHTYNDNTIYMFNEYWVSLYPFLYYFIGSYISEYKPKVNKIAVIFVFLATLIYQIFYILKEYKDAFFPTLLFGEYNSIFVVIASVCLFLLLYDIDFKNRFIKGTLRSISKKTFDIYLFSYIFDTLVYAYAQNYNKNFQQYNNWFIICVALSFGLSYVCALIKEKLFVFTGYGFNKISESLKKTVQPTCKIKSVFCLDALEMKNDNIKLVIFDADCTLIEDKSFEIEDKMLEKISEIESVGIDIIIASNGKIHRINKVFENHPIKAYPMCLKPLPFKVGRIIKGYEKNEVVLIGDQFFTDILCARLLKIKSYMVAPYGEGKGSFIKVKRFFEKRIVGDFNKWE